MKAAPPKHSRTFPSPLIPTMIILQILGIVLLAIIGVTVVGVAFVVLISGLSDGCSAEDAEDRKLTREIERWRAGK